MTAPEMVTVTSRTQALERPTADNPIATAPVLGAGMVPLGRNLLDLGVAPARRWHDIRHNRGLDHSDVPISQPEPRTLTQELLAERGLHLFPDCSANPGRVAAPDAPARAAPSDW